MQFTCKARYVSLPKTLTKYRILGKEPFCFIDVDFLHRIAAIANPLTAMGPIALHKYIPKGQRSMGKRERRDNSDNAAHYLGEMMSLHVKIKEKVPIAPR